MSKNIVHPKNDSDFLSRHHCYPLFRMKKQGAPKVKHRKLTIRLWRTKHTFWHYLFYNATIDEVIYRLSWDNSIYQNPNYPKVFHCNRFVALEILKRIKRIKTRKL